jgi:hypothetical protein
MAVNKSYALRQSCLLLLILLAWIVALGEARGAMLYKYIDEDGTVVITDTPPPEFKLIPDSVPELMEEKKSELDQEQEKGRGKSETVREIQERGPDRQEKIKAARSEWEQAKTYEENYRMNMQEATTYDKRLYWRQMYDKQQKVVEEKKKNLDDLMY